MIGEGIARELIEKSPFVSRETMERLAVIVAQLEKWQPRINLVAPSTMGHIWSRHILDSLQLVSLAEEARQWIDLGSGGGFPGLVVAAFLAEHSGASMTLVESNAKKCAFLRETARVARLPVIVLNQRIGDALPTLATHYDVVSARALASLAELLAMAEPLLSKGARGLFLKGQDVDDELKMASASWNLGYDLVESQTEPNAKVVVVKFASRRV